MVESIILVISGGIRVVIEGVSPTQPGQPPLVPAHPIQPGPEQGPAHPIQPPARPGAPDPARPRPA
jgi:hypothetical protein